MSRQLLFTKELGVNNRAHPGVNVVYPDSSSRLHFLKVSILEKNSWQKNHAGKLSLGKRQKNKGDDKVLCNDLTHSLHQRRNSGASVPKKVGMKK
jgi:hypothetical protein